MEEVVTLEVETAPPADEELLEDSEALVEVADQVVEEVAPVVPWRNRDIAAESWQCRDTT